MSNLFLSYFHCPLSVINYNPGHSYTGVNCLTTILSMDDKFQLLKFCSLHYFSELIAVQVRRSANGSVTARVRGIGEEEGFCILGV